MYARPIITVNNSIGTFLMDHYTTTTLTGWVNQTYLEETSEKPGAAGSNIYGNITIERSQNDSVAILSNRYDGMWGQTSGDSAVSGAILLGIIKYFNDHHSIKPKYNLTFLFTTSEEFGFHGARFHVDNHSDQNIVNWIILEQSGFDQSDTGLSLCFSNESQKDIYETILNDSNYNEYDSWVSNSAGAGSEQGTVNKIFKNNVCLGKGDKRIHDNGKDYFVGTAWDNWHRAGADYFKGDSKDNIDRDDVNATAKLTLGLVKYFMINPDSWFDGSATYTAEDSPYDTDDDNDSINVTLSVKSSLPQDKIRVNATVKSWPSNTTVFWKNYDFNVTSGGTQKTLIVTLPPYLTGATSGNYSLTLNLLNSTGRINDIALHTRVYDDTDTQSGYVYLTPRNNSIPNKPSDITFTEPINYTTSTTDSNLDQLQYEWVWHALLYDLHLSGDIDYAGPCDSGEDCTVQHTYLLWGLKDIKVRARDDYGYLFDGSPLGWNRYGNWSEWSDILSINEQMLTDFSMSCTSFSSVLNARSATELPSILLINSTYNALVFGESESLTYRWTFNGRDAVQGKTTEHNFSDTGNYRVTLNVSDDNGYSTEFSVNVSVINLSANFNLSIPSPFAEINENITFTDTSAVVDEYQITDWMWDFGDGSISNNRNTTHSFTEMGLYNVSLTVWDNQSNSDTFYRNIFVFLDEVPPEIQQVNDETNVKNRWLEVMIAGSFNDTESGIDHALVNITYPNGTHANYTMNHFVNGTYWYVFNDTAQTGQYNYTIWVTDFENNTSNATGYSITIPTPPILQYTTTTPADNADSKDDWVNVNVTVFDPLNTSAFIDWNHSLTGYWPMESYNDTGVYDNSTYENFGAFQNGMNTRNIVPGKYGDGLEFDGSDDYLDLGTSNSLDLGTGDFTFMVWEKSHTTLYSKKAMILTNSPAMESWKGYGFGVTNSPYLIVSQSAGNNITLQGTTDVTDNTWHHIAYVCRSEEYLIYVDGELDADNGGWMPAKNITNAQHTMIAYDGHCSSWCYFEGLLDEPQLYNRALGWEEINASYNNGLYRLSHNFTGLTDGTYSYSAHAIDTTGNQGNTETRQILIDTTPPTFTNVNASPHTVGFGYNVTITADVIDNVSGVDLVTIQIIPPSGVGNSSNNTMTLISNNTYQYVFTDTWSTGQYNYTIWAIDVANNTASSSGHHFHVSAEATISIATLRNTYTGNQYINITDPPNPPENYILVDRGLTWNTYYNATSGENILETFQGPVNFQEENGTWTPINNTLMQLASNHPAYVYGYRQGNDRGSFGVYFKSNAQQDWPVVFTYNKSDDPTIHAVKSKLVGVGYVDPQSNWAYQYLQNVQNSQGQTNCYSITYPGVFTGTDVTWSYGNTGLKEEITMSNATKTVLQNHPPSQYGLNDASSYLVFITKLDYQNLNLYNNSGLLDGNVTISDAGVDFKDVLGQFKCALPLGEAYELSNESARQKLTYRIIHLNGNTYLLSGLKVSDLNAMTFPVVIDPTLTVYSISSDGHVYNSGTSYTTVQAASTGTVSGSGAYITIGQRKLYFPDTYYIYRGFVFFNTSTLPSNAYLDDAALSLYKKDDYSSTDFDITIQNGQPTYPHNPMQSSDYNKNYYSGNGGSLNTSKFTSGYNAITLSNLNWINKTGITKLCLRSSRDISGTAPTGSEYVNVHSSEFLGMCPPKLVINYRNQSKIKNTGSTNIKGYLLIQIQFYNTSQAKWVIDNDTVNESIPRVINAGGSGSGSQLGLDTIFNRLVRASDLTHGTGTYRVYTAFRDPEGNNLKTNDDVDLEAWWQFSKT
ncbi:MAG TPA: LamG-like jellyroll fold domain-containing protein [Candidatus Thermoplasmatota archaeon]|nr:LamG-like jellyroll fold domain-containing protein [Candidatus Thermoplasmatota archaeon]